jgi:hypothetical protein
MAVTSSAAASTSPDGAPVRHAGITHLTSICLCYA